MKAVSMITLFFAALAAATPAPASTDAGDSSPDLTEAKGVAPLPGVRAHKNHLYVCDSANFKGRCQNLENDAGKCYNLGNRWPNTISSVRPSKHTTCTLYNLNNCKGRKYGGIVAPGVKNLVGTGLNDATNSFVCS